MRFINNAICATRLHVVKESQSHNSTLHLPALMKDAIMQIAKIDAIAGASTARLTMHNAVKR